MLRNPNVYGKWQLLSAHPKPLTLAPVPSGPLYCWALKYSQHKDTPGKQNLYWFGIFCKNYLIVEIQPRSFPYSTRTCWRNTTETFVDTVHWFQFIIFCKSSLIPYQQQNSGQEQTVITESDWQLVFGAMVRLIIFSDIFYFSCTGKHPLYYRRNSFYHCPITWIKVGDIYPVLHHFLRKKN